MFFFKKIGKVYFLFIRSVETSDEDFYVSTKSLSDGLSLEAKALLEKSVACLTVPGH